MAHHKPLGDRPRTLDVSFRISTLRAKCKRAAWVWSSANGCPVGMGAMLACAYASTLLYGSEVFPLDVTSSEKEFASIGRRLLHAYDTDKKEPVLRWLGWDPVR